MRSLVALTLCALCCTVLLSSFSLVHSQVAPVHTLLHNGEITQGNATRSTPAFFRYNQVQSGSDLMLTLLGDNSTFGMLWQTNMHPPKFFHVLPYQPLIVNASEFNNASAPFDITWELRVNTSSTAGQAVRFVVAAQESIVCVEGAKCDSSAQPTVNLETGIYFLLATPINSSFDLSVEVQTLNPDVMVFLGDNTLLQQRPNPDNSSTFTAWSAGAHRFVQPAGNHSVFTNVSSEGNIHLYVVSNSSKALASDVAITYRTFFVPEGTQRIGTGHTRGLYNRTAQNVYYSYAPEEYHVDLYVDTDSHMYASATNMFPNKSESGHQWTSNVGVPMMLSAADVEALPNLYINIPCETLECNGVNATHEFYISAASSCPQGARCSGVTIPLTSGNYTSHFFRLDASNGDMLTLDSAKDLNIELLDDFPGMDDLCVLAGDASAASFRPRLSHPNSYIGSKSCGAKRMTVRAGTAGVVYVGGQFHVTVLSKSSNALPFTIRWDQRAYQNDTQLNNEEVYSGHWNGTDIAYTAYTLTTGNSDLAIENLSPAVTIYVSSSPNPTATTPNTVIVTGLGKAYFGMDQTQTAAVYYIGAQKPKTLTRTYRLKVSEAMLCQIGKECTGTLNQDVTERVFRVDRWASNTTDNTMQVTIDTDMPNVCVWVGNKNHSTFRPVVKDASTWVHSACNGVTAVLSDLTNIDGTFHAVVTSSDVSNNTTGNSTAPIGKFTLKFTTVANDSGSSGLKWWGILLIVIAALVVVVGGVFVAKKFCCNERNGAGSSQPLMPSGASHY